MREAGRELDVEVARLMGWVDFWEGRDEFREYLMAYPPNEQAMGINAERVPVPPYSTDISAAWLVVDWMREHVPDYHALRMETVPLGYMVAFYSHKNPLDRAGAFVAAETAPLAICLAVLQAVGVPN